MFFDLRVAFLMLLLVAMPTNTMLRDLPKKASQSSVVANQSITAIENARATPFKPEFQPFEQRHAHACAHFYESLKSRP